MPNYEITNNESRHQYEAHVEGSVALAQYERRGNEIIFFHTETPRALQGRGIAGAIIQKALEDAKSAGLTVVPQCSFVHDYIEKHPEFQPLVAGR